MLYKPCLQKRTETLGKPTTAFFTYPNGVKITITAKEDYKRYPPEIKAVMASIALNNIIHKLQEEGHKK